MGSVRAFWAACLLCGCSDGRPDPYRPADDLSWLVHDYDFPSAELDVAGLDAALTRAAPLLGALTLGERLTFVTSAVDEAATDFGAQRLGVSTSVSISGKVAVHLACPGVDSAGGRVDVTLPVLNSKLGPAGEGTASACSFLASDVPLPPWLEVDAEVLGERRIELDGPLGVHLGDALSLGEEVSLRPTVRVLGTLRGTRACQRFEARGGRGGVARIRRLRDAGARVP